LNGHTTNLSPGLKRKNQPEQHNKQYRMEDQVNSFRLNGHTLGSLQTTSKLEPIVEQTNYCFSVILFLGYGHLAPKTQGGRLFLIFFALFGIPLNLLTLQSVGEHINYGIHLLIKYFEKAAFERDSPSHEHIKCFAINVMLIALWLPLGGVMYFYSETEWTFLDSVYYCFVALSTIGFGDLVPNQGKEPDSSYERGMWIVRLMYLGLGLSLLSSIFTSVLYAGKQIQGLMPLKRGKI